MKELYTEGLATHGDPESCAGRRKAAGEALTGAHVGRVLSREITSSRGQRRVSRRKATSSTRVRASEWTARRGRRPLACVEPLCARTGRSPDRPRVAPRAASERPKVVRR